ncbi:hypothetical protein CHS0354_029013 [Potamilus streckersoni]|uniref:inositol-phosphate phosphatase n=1 Tax=Potamilus streckersoni TaxID=2493646 RepID=A0AAE0VV56_9BIVA|nr:hypothetical protein CHS0354_029013 [Potamilus streckersoni]
MAPVNVKINRLGGVVCIAVGLCLFLYLFDVPEWFKEEQRISMKELLSVSIELAKRGGDKVWEIRAENTLAGKSKGKTKEGADEMLTRGDLESHKTIVHGLAKAFPGLKVISEEHESQPVDFKRVPEVNKKIPEVEPLSDQSIIAKDVTMWIDPLDATQEYTDDLTQYVTTMVCVAVKGQPTIGVIHKPFLNSGKGETYWGWVGHGQSSSLKKSEESKRDENSPHKIIVSRSHQGQVEKVSRELLGEKAEITAAGGAGYKTLEVITGNSDAYVHITLIKKWDICAGNAIISSLDGKMTTLKGEPIDYSFDSNPKNEDGLLTTLYNHDFYLKRLAPAAHEHKKSSYD